MAFIRRLTGVENFCPRKSWKTLECLLTFLEHPFVGITANQCLRIRKSLRNCQDYAYEWNHCYFLNLQLKEFEYFFPYFLKRIGAEEINFFHWNQEERIAHEQ